MRLLYMCVLCAVCIFRIVMSSSSSKYGEPKTDLNMNERDAHTNIHKHTQLEKDDDESGTLRDGLIPKIRCLYVKAILYLYLILRI